MTKLVFTKFNFKTNYDKLVVVFLIWLILVPIKETCNRTLMLTVAVDY